MSLLSLPKRYSEACHKAYYTSGIAPELLTCEWMYVVIMELLEKYSSLFSLAQEQKLSQLVEEKVIEAGEVVYPPFMNKEIDWQPGVKVGEKILPEHDPGMLDNEFKNV
ncbi:8569_t:CDS:2 [Paraglomus brasilianum]|uniref:8569_t:CDS:1 n=1 Tax=Paraglomus brasilianum TaxID=144538 RepID=A0A9N9DN84_9GLOM|nr:8569_t:CDS:2 [Paraglomus brasilianum]